MDRRRRLIELGVALAIALLGGLLGRGVVASWLAVAGGLAAFAFAVPLLAPWARALLARAERQAPRLVRAAPGAAVVFAALVPFRGVLVGEVPLGHDHPVHLARAWHFVHESLGRGRLHGFSELWFAGWPAGYDYPIGGDLWVSTFYLATFGAFGWTLTYGIAVAAMYAVVVHAHYTFGRVYLGRAAGVLVGALALLDRGAGNEGGWSYTIEWGVWPFALGMAFVLYTLSLLDGVAREGGARRIAWAALPAAFSVLCHPFAIVAYVVAVPLFLLARGAQPPTSSERWAGVAARCAAAVGLGVGLSAAWLFPFVASGDWFLRFGDLYVPVEEVARRLLRGELYGWAPLISVLAIVGAARSFRRRIPVGVFCAGLALLALVASSRTFVEALDLGAYSSSLMRIPFQRMAYLVKPAAFVLVAIALFGGRRGRVGASAPSSAPSEATSEPSPAPAEAISLASEALHVAGSTAPSTSRTTWWPTRYVVLAALAFAPLVLPLLSEARAYLPNFAVATDVALEGELRAFSAWLDARRAEDPDFYRVAYVDGSEDHDLKAAIAFTGRPALHSGFTPATTYRHRYDRVDPALYRVLGVRYVVARSPLTEPWAEPLERFGRLHVHGLRAPRTERVTLEGEGRVEVLRFEPEGAGVELRVSGAAPGDRLVLHVGSFSGWRAWRDGAPLEVESRPLAGHEGFVSVPAADGRTRLAFVRGTSEHVGLVVSLLAMLALGLLFARSRWPAGVTARLDRAGAFLGARTRRLAAGAVTLVALVFLAVALTRPPPRALVDRLAGIQVDLVRGDRADRCEREGDRHQCSDEDWNYVGRKYQWFAYPGAVHPTEGEVRRCVWAHPVVGADLRLRVPGVRLGDPIEGGHALMNRGAGALSLTAYVDGEVVDQVGGPTGPAYIWRPFSLRTGALAGRVVDLDLVVRSTGAGPWHYCFDVDLPR